MAGQKYSAHGLTVSVDSVQVTGLVNVTVGGGSTGEAETTDSDSGGVREFVRGLSDSGQLSLEMRHIPGDSGQANLRTLKASGATVEIEITLPDSATDSSDVGTLTFDGFVQNFDYDLPTAEDQAAMATSNIRISGDVTEAVA